ncbi:hypothetical protein FJZ53_00585 [Candidatus Woesearchaeota archaeon]|nr:hypothetical protein [Candidatus Woesearchaeota archaeon]
MVQFQTVFLKMAEFAEKEFPEECEKAQKEYKEKTSGIKVISSGAFGIGFFSWFVLEREISGSELTPAEIYYYKFFDDIPEDELETVERLKDARPGIYEVTERRGKKYMVKDVFTEELFHVKTKDLDLKLDVDDLIKATLVKISDKNYIFHGGINVCSDGSKEKMLERIKKSAEFAKIQMEKFFEYFKCYDPEFRSMKEAFEANIRFMEWYNKQRSAELGIKPQKLDTPEFEIEEEFERVGLICTETGICTVPNYGYIKDLFTGNYKKLQDFEDLLYDVIEEEAYIPSSILKDLMIKNKENCVKVFKEAYEGIKGFDDALELAREHREDFDKKEPVRVVAAQPEELKGLGNRKKPEAEFSIKTVCKRCGKEFECDEDMLISGDHFCKDCLALVNKEVEKFSNFVDQNVEELQKSPEKFLEKMAVFAKDTFCNGSWEKFKEAMKDSDSPYKEANDDLIRMAEKLENEEKKTGGKAGGKQ